MSCKHEEGVKKQSNLASVQMCTLKWHNLFFIKKYSLICESIKKNTGFWSIQLRVKLMTWMQDSLWDPELWQSRSLSWVCTVCKFKHHAFYKCIHMQDGNGRWGYCLLDGISPLVSCLKFSLIQFWFSMITGQTTTGSLRKKLTWACVWVSRQILFSIHFNRKMSSYL